MFLLILITDAALNFAVTAPLLMSMQLLLKYIDHVSASVFHKIGIYVFSFLMAGIFLVTGVPSILTIYPDADISFRLFEGLFSYYDQYIKNVLLFIPFGFLVPLLWNQYNARKTVLSGFMLSLTIEIMQLFCFRATDINDLWTNTLGTLAGYLLFLVLKKLSPKTVKHFDLNSQNLNVSKFFHNEMYIYILITWLVLFFIHPFLSDFLMRFIYRQPLIREIIVIII